MLGESLSFPRQGDDWLKTVLIGGILTILSPLVIPVLPVLGYLVRVTRAGVTGETDPPVFDDWGDLFVDGILVFVIQLAYSIVPTILYMMGLFTVVGGAFAAGSGADAAGTGIGLVGGLILLVSVLLLLLAAYFIPAAVANFAYEDDFGAAFDLGTVREAAFTADYFVAVVLAIVVALVLGFIAAILSVVLVGIFLLFYVQMSVYYLLGRGFGKALGIEPTDGTDGTGGTGRETGDDEIPDPDPLT